MAIPDPGFAGSALAALGYLGSADGYGMDFYQRLKDNGTVVVASPVDVLTGVAEGNYDVGITLDKLARDAIDKGSPIAMVWPEPGAIAVFSPAAVVAASDDLAAAQALQAFLVSPKGSRPSPALVGSPSEKTWPGPPRARSSLPTGTRYTVTSNDCWRSTTPSSVTDRDVLAWSRRLVPPAALAWRPACWWSCP